MTYFFFIIKSALSDFSRNKGRTFLTSLGILIGVLSVVLLTAFGLGLKKYIKNQFESLGTNVVSVVPGKLLRNGNFQNNGPASFGSIRFDEKDMLMLKRLPLATYVSPSFTKSVTVTAMGNTEFGDIYTVSAEIFPARNLNPEFGELFTVEDEEKSAKVAVLGPKIAEKLFLDKQDAVGKKIKADGISFTVLGVLEDKGGGGFGGPDFDSFIYIPYKTGYLYNTDKKFVAFVVAAEDESRVPMLKEEVTTELLKRYKEDDFSVIEATEILDAISSIFNILNTVLTAIAAISLVVGGIGIMNIMYVSVTERTREVGIRRAIGAKAADILLQFLSEAIILSLFGGMSGLLLAYLITLAIQSVFPAYISLDSVILAISVSTGIGIIFGVFPARKAANLSPIEAIRYE